MTSAPPARRPSCPSCLRPQSACICRWVRPVLSSVEVLILQHPLEVDEAKGSARLLHLCLPGSRMLTGEVFDPAILLARPLEDRQDILLYPDSPQDKSSGLLPPPVFDAVRLQKNAKIRLIVLDGTWRKSRKMLYLNPALQQMPRLSLQNLPASSYLIRKAHKPGQLSTLEAACAALAQLEADAQKYQPLLA
ncbi:MAG: tRNA-uridine aminocarboxypropyltransferase, partial [Pseudomonadota bacterium]